MARSNKKRDGRIGPLKQLIQEALAAREELKSGEAPSVDGISLPFLKVDLNASKIATELGPPKRSAELFIKRLHAFQYPYPHGTKKNTTFYTHLEKLGLLQFFLTPSFLRTIRLAWQFRLFFDLEQEQHKKSISQYGHPIAFHRELMFQIAGYLKQLSAITKKHGVPDPWVQSHRRSLLMELLRQAAVCYPQLFTLQRSYRAPSRIRPVREGATVQMLVLDEIYRTFYERKIKENKELAYQLTALICSPDECVNTQELSPTPAAVRTNDRARTLKF